MSHETARPFRDRLRACVACGVALLVLLYAKYFAYWRSPIIRKLLQDFDCSPSPLSAFCLEWPHVPIIVAYGALAAAVCVWTNRRRNFLSVAYLLAICSFALTLAADIGTRISVLDLVDQLHAP